MKRLAKIVAAALCAAMLTASLAACSSNNSSNTSSGTNSAAPAPTASVTVSEKDAEENGEDTWKACDVRYFINEAVRYYLLYLREGNASGYISKAVWSLVCGAWVARTR